MSSISSNTDGRSASPRYRSASVEPATKRQRSLWRICLATTLLAVVVMSAGRVVAQELEREAPPPHYRIQVGDELGIKFFYNSDLNEEVVVRPDGRIALQLIPETVAAGKTPSELAEELRELYSAELDRPAITVMVRSFAAQRIYVGGEVEEPGEQTLVGPVTVMQAIARAQGARPTARLKEVLVIRRSSGGEPIILPVDIAKVLKGVDMSQDIELVPYDVVYLPRTKIANVNKWVDEYIRQNIPFSFGFRIEVQ